MHHFLARLKVRDAADRSRRMFLEHRDQEALRSAMEAHALAVQSLDHGDIEYILAFSALATALVQTKREKAATKLLESVADKAAAVLSELPAERHAVLNNLAICYGRAGEPERAIAIMEAVVDDKAKIYGEDSMELFGNIEDLVIAFDNAGRFGDAEAKLRQMLRIVEREFGKESREYVQTLSNLAGCLNQARKKKEADLVRKRIGELGSALNDEQRDERLEREAMQAYRDGDFLLARRLHRALQARNPRSILPSFMTDVLGDMFDPLVQFAGTLDKEGVEAEESGNFETAIQRYRAIVTIFSVSSDRYGMQTSQAMNNLALAHQRSGDLTEAKHWFVDAVSTMGPLLWSEHGAPIIANVVALFSALCDRDAPDPAKDYDAAMALLDGSAQEKGKTYARSMRIRLPIPDPNDDAAERFRKIVEARIVFYLSYGAVEPVRTLRAHLVDLHTLLFRREPRRVLTPLLAFIEFYVERGPMEQARMLLDRAAVLSSEVLTEEPVVAADVLRWEARFRSVNRDDAGAEDALMSARELLADHVSELDALDLIEDDLLIVWMRQGRFDKDLKQLLDRVIAKKQTSEYIDRPENVQHLASLLMYREDWAGAESLLRKAAAMQETAIGEWDPRYALTISNLGNLLRMSGRATEAVPLLRQAADIRELEFGGWHQTTTSARVRLAIALGSAARWEDALAEMQKVMTANEIILQATASVTSREQLFRFLNEERSTLDLFISIALNLSDRQRATQLVYKAVLRRKGLAAEALAARRLPLLSERYPEQRPVLVELDQISSILSEQLLSSRHSAEDLNEARRRKQQLETTLAARIPEIRFDSVWRHTDLDEIRHALGKNCVLLEYVQFQPFNFNSIVTDGDSETLPARYIGFAVSRARQPLMEVLGSAHSIGQAVAEFGQLLAGEACGSGQLFGGDKEQRTRLPVDRESLERAGQRVRRAVWEPLSSELADAEHVLVAPDGRLSLLPFDLLPSPDNQLLMDVLLISNVGSGRDVIPLSDRTIYPTSEPVLFCAPDFDSADAQGPPKDAQRDFLQTMSRSGINRVPPLPGAEREGREIRELLPGSHLYVGAAATERRLRAVCSPLALHIATHGFSVQRREPSFESDSMFFSGLVFAGVNAALQSSADSSMNDAILTGEEAATLNLKGTELVVLSACRSGLGRTVPGEGVFGLHRAFAVAGARCVISSLWKIPDEQTTELMRFLYLKLRQGSSRASALREAKQHIRAKYPQPYFWGSFLCHGDWREIQQWVSESN